jgi:hypothetical protein
MTTKSSYSSLTGEIRMELLKQPQTGKGPAETFAGGDLIEAHPGDIIYTPPGEEHVTDAEYNGPRVSTRR